MEGFESIPLNRDDKPLPGGDYIKQERKATEGKEQKKCPRCGVRMEEVQSDLGAKFVCPRDNTEWVDQEKEAA